ncbi:MULTISPECIES: anti-adapter protein IraP [Tenebrionibacter/Tenebrionicola group]|jgi:hypothetical protein|uniref:Anti-adapter protein IraP n=2 Tax=Tenebrionibacter/Tenebrionicola group TaxID=2969848 RepID=A0A8K0V630_9ENTR|nr:MULTISPECIES: anti-adapter protein IraP [Tenebrionibacter/Tenebrionicola group]MBK4715805.1 anti-adapter protein IraP [Tenebrionibacter intestinalis]MBV5096503.1 anti-adapter protein IraP [Tenebrionicola larvae]
MKNLIAELLVKLAEKDAELDEQDARISALECLVTLLIGQMSSTDFYSFTTRINEDITQFTSCNNTHLKHPELIQQHMRKLLQLKPK